jgi:hypothetical protein
VPRRPLRVVLLVFVLAASLLAPVSQADAPVILETERGANAPATPPPGTDHVVHTGAGLARLSETALPGATIFIPGNTTLWVEPGAVTFDQPGITIRSTGGQFGVGGATIRQQGERGGWTYGEAVLSFSGRYSTVRGVRLVGLFPEGDRGSGESALQRPASAGVFFGGDNSTIYNSELTGWTRAGVVFEETSGGRVYLSSLHHNYDPDIGYGIHVRRSDPLVQYNYFNGNRHAISSQRDAESSYVARGNVVGGDRPNHAFDVHGASRSDRAYGGGRIVIVNNTFLAPADNSDGPASNPIEFRGALGPREGARVANNLFVGVSAEEAMVQSREDTPPQEFTTAATPSEFVAIEWTNNAIVAHRSEAPVGVGAPASMPPPSRIPGGEPAGIGPTLRVLGLLASIGRLGPLGLLFACGLVGISLLAVARWLRV